MKTKPQNKNLKIVESKKDQQEKKTENTVEQKENVDLDENQLKEKLENKRLERRKKCAEELKQWLKERNAILTTSAEVLIDGKKVGVVLDVL